MKIWLSACKLLLVLVSISLLLSNSILLLANSAPSSSLHQPKILCHDQEKYALLHFKQSFSIDCGKSYPVVAYSKIQMWPELDHVGNANRVDCCRWDGVICNNETGHVIGLDLSSSCLYGNFPLNSTIFGLDHLVELNLADNNFTYSQIPSEIGRLNKLIYLNLSLSAFSGQIPAEMAKLSSLSYLDLSYNGDFLGDNDQYSLKLHDLSFEKLLANLTQITQLFLSRVDISSTVPLFVANRTLLQAISLHDCNLLGKIPPNLLKLPNLEEVELYSNLNLRGHLPEFHSNSPLRYLLLSQTSFSGKLPNSLGNLASLEILDLEMCYFKGNIPLSLGNLSKLTTLSLSNNHLRGDFPSSLVNLTQLSILTLSDMKIVDPVILKSWLLKLVKLVQLELSRMNLNDEILPNLANLTSLSYLVLEDNQLTMPLSHWLVNLTQLKTLNIRGNQFQGTIPPWLPYFVNLGTLYISFKGSRGEFDPFLKLPNLHFLYLSGLTLSFPSNIKVNSSVLSLRYLGIDSCNLTEFPKFLQNQKELQEVSLSHNNIAGDIPQWFVNTTRESLIVLDLSNNLLTSFEQPQTILPWVNLEILNLDDNKFRGQVMIPPSSMQAYQVKNNRYSGVIPSEICQASSLIFLDFSNNSLRGHIPNCISHQLGDSLQVLNLQGNNFDGTIPQNFSKSCKLKMINLGQNQFKGELPKSLVNCSMLEVLDVGKNLINDTFPTRLGSLPRLQVLVLRYNHFHGKIATPKPYYGFPCLRILDMSYNFHIGDLPSTYIQSWSAMKVFNEDKSDSYMSSITIGLNILGVDYFIGLPYHYAITITNKGSERFYSSLLTVFRVVDFSHNFFSGAITEAISELRGLQALNLSNNNLVGSIPSSLANMNELESLDLSQNMLSGEIPQTLAKLTSLEVFNVSHNRLVGPIPQGEQFNTFDDSSFQGNLALCGFPLPEKCGNKDFPPESAPTQETEDNSMWIDWLIRSLGCASGFVIGFVIGKIFITDTHHDWFIDTFGRRKWPKTRARSAPRGPRNS